MRESPSYFLWMSWLLLALVVVGFASAGLAFTRDELLALPGHLHVHAVTLMSWYVLLVVQASLVGKQSVDLHRRLGPFAMLIGAGCVFAGPLATLGAVAKFHRAGLTWTSDMSEFPVLGIEGMTLEQFSRLLVFGNFASVAIFALLLLGAYRFRKQAHIHKRLILLATIQLTPPALARISRWPGLGGEDSLFIPLSLLLLLLSVPVYDWYVHRRVQRTTWIALVMIVVVNGAFIGFSGTELAGQFVYSLAG